MEVIKIIRFAWLLFAILLLFEKNVCSGKQTDKNFVEEISDMKDFKKLLRTKNNVLTCFISSAKAGSAVLKPFRETANVIRGEGTLVLVNCSGDGKKICKKLKIAPDPVILKHYKDGEFNKDYERRLTVQSMVNFMRDPSGDLPWEEDPTGRAVIHLTDPTALADFLAKEYRPAMIMFYAPWCGYCKQMKPEYAAAAYELRGLYALAAMDLHRPENNIVKHHYNITSFPTLIYFQDGKKKYVYDGQNKKEDIMTFIRDPKSAMQKKPIPWSETVDTSVVHLTAQNFDTVINMEEQILVMFHAPWCVTCIQMRDEYERAAVAMKEEKVKGTLAAVDTGKEFSLAKKYKISSYPSLKYFRNGTFELTVDLDDADKIVTFMKDPSLYETPEADDVNWEEESSVVQHLDSITLVPYLKKTKHALVMFYAPWCNHCKIMKPEFNAAAKVFKDDLKVGFYGVDCTVEENICNSMDVRSYPTLRYFKYHTRAVETYVGRRMKEDFVKFIMEQQIREGDETPALDKLHPWKDHKGSEYITILTDATFDEFIGRRDPVLVIFYSPQSEKSLLLLPHASDAAMDLSAEKSRNKIAVVDCSKNLGLVKRYNIKEYPHLKLFHNGYFLQVMNQLETKEDIKQVFSDLKSSKTKEEL